MDIQKLITDVVTRLKADPEILKKFAADPVGTLEKVFNIDLPDEQINSIIEGVKGQIDLSKLDASEAVGLLAKLKGLFGGK